MIKDSHMAAPITFSWMQTTGDASTESLFGSLARQRERFWLGKCGARYLCMIDKFANLKPSKYLLVMLIGTISKQTADN
jgi:hypothetical protein